MAHYAFLKETDDDNLLVVVDVITGVDEDDTTNLPSQFTTWEEFYEDQRNMTCKRYSYWTDGNEHLNGGTPFRGNAAGISDLYDIDNDVFYGEKPFDSWVLNTSTWRWEAPISFPSDTNSYFWNEELHQGDSANPKTLGWQQIT